MHKLSVRRREMKESSPKDGLRQSWVEYQILEGRKIVARCGTENEAKKKLLELTRVTAC